MEHLVNATLLLIDPEKIIETPEGVNIFPRPYRVRDVSLDKNWFDFIIQKQRECMQTDEMFAVRMQDEEDPESPPVYATYILSPSYIIPPLSNVTGGIN